MNIVCPQCDFTRQVSEDRLPGASVIATCPRCGHRFRISRPEAAAASADSPKPVLPGGAPDAPNMAQGSTGRASEALHDSQEDDPLPPGALIPRHQDDVPPAAHSVPPVTPIPKGHEVPPPSTTFKDNAKDKEQPPHASPLTHGAGKGGAEEEAERRRIAAEAYEKQAEEGGSAFALKNPWEYPDEDGFLAAFYQTAMRVMFAAPRFFAGLSPHTPQMRAMLFYLIVSVLQICIERFWGGVLSSVLAPTAGNDPQLQKLLQMLSPENNIIFAILMRSALVTMEIFIFAGLYFLVFKILVPTKANYSLIFQVLAYSSAPALLCVVPVVGSVVGFVWGIACGFVGCRYTMGLTWAQTTMALVPIYLLGIPIILQVVASIQSM